MTPLHSLREAAALLGMSEKWVRNRVQNGADCTRVGNRIKFTDEQILALTEANAA